jgi:6-pyruvoyl-tetrahydropterin synthase
MSSADIPIEDNLKSSEGIVISKEIVGRKIADRNRNKNLTDQSKESRKDQRSKRSDHGQETENTRRNIARVIKTKAAVRTTRKNIKDALIHRIPIEKTRGHLHLQSKNPRSKKTLSPNINHSLLSSLKTSTKSSKSTKEGICRLLRREMKVLLSQAQLCHHRMGSRMMMEILRQFEECQIGKSDGFAGIGFYFEHFLICITH